MTSRRREKNDNSILFLSSTVCRISWLKKSMILLNSNNGTGTETETEQYKSVWQAIGKWAINIKFPYSSKLSMKQFHYEILQYNKKISDNWLNCTGNRFLVPHTQIHNDKDIERNRVRLSKRVCSIYGGHHIANTIEHVHIENLCDFY